MTTDLLAEIETLYRAGIDRPKVAHWFAAYELVSRYLTANPASTWAKGPDALPLDGAPKALVRRRASRRVSAEHVLRGLQKKLAGVVESTKGITG